jgi:hypothetical protein
MRGEIQLLDASLLADEKTLDELSYWFRVMNKPNGWHYDLDHIWILSELEKAAIKPGATIVDAGAGQGILQYLLASRGYNVISLDFSPRTIPQRTLGIFSIDGDGLTPIHYDHSYMRVIDYGGGKNSSLWKNVSMARVKKIPLYIGRNIRSRIYWLKERFFVNHEKYGHITYVRAPFHETTLGDAIADAVVSVSAIEHADISLFRENIDSLARLLKPGSPMLLTTSAIKDEKSSYNETVAGWCFSRNDIAELLPHCRIEFNEDACENSLLNSPEFISRIDPYYFQKGQLFYASNFSTLPYLPLCIKYLAETSQ